MATKFQLSIQQIKQINQADKAINLQLSALTSINEFTQIDNLDSTNDPK